MKNILSFLKLIKTPLLILLAVLILLEIFLQLGSLFISTGTNRSADLGSSKIRILALGESTTDYRVSIDQKAWPERLERILNEKGIPVEVFNQGSAGINSSQILSRISANVEEYRPHLVISMMGVNDIENMKFNYSETSFRTLKLFYLLLERLNAAFSCKLQGEDYFDIKTIEGWDEIYKYDLEEIEKMARRYFDTNQKVAVALSRMVTHRDIRQMHSQKIISILERAFKLHPLSDEITKTYLYFLRSTNDRRCMEVVNAIKDCAPNLSDEMFMLITHCLQETGTKLDLSTLRRRGLEMVKPQQGNLKQNYELLSKILSERNIKHVAMQYPTLPLSSLEAVLNDSKVRPAAFISNEENFKEALKVKTFDEIFQDRFRGSWGHTTPFGDELIAQEVAISIEPLVREILRKSNGAQLQSAQP